MIQEESAEAKNDCRSNVLRLADPPQRSERFNILAEVALGDSGGMRPFRLDDPRIDCIYADVPQSQFFGQRFCHRIDAALVAL